MKEQFGPTAGNLVHLVAYTLVPIGLASSFGALRAGEDARQLPGELPQGPQTNWSEVPA